VATIHFSRHPVRECTANQPFPGDDKEDGNRRRCNKSDDGYQEDKCHGCCTDKRHYYFVLTLAASLTPLTTALNMQQLLQTRSSAIAKAPRDVTRFFKFCPNYISVIGEARQFKFLVLIDTDE